MALVIFLVLETDFMRREISLVLAIMNNWNIFYFLHYLILNSVSELRQLGFGEAEWRSETQGVIRRWSELMPSVKYEIVEKLIFYFTK